MSALSHCGTLPRTALSSVWVLGTLFGSNLLAMFLHFRCLPTFLLSLRCKLLFTSFKRPPHTVLSAQPLLYVRVQSTQLILLAFGLSLKRFLPLHKCQSLLLQF